MKTLVIDGNKLYDLKSLYQEFDLTFTSGLDWNTGHNLDSLNDLLSGGFGVFDYHEKIRLKWINYSQSKLKLGIDLLLAFKKIIKEHQHIDFAIQD